MHEHQKSLDTLLNNVAFKRKVHKLHLVIGIIIHFLFKAVLLMQVLSFYFNVSFNIYTLKHLTCLLSRPISILCFLVRSRKFVAVAVAVGLTTHLYLRETTLCCGLKYFILFFNLLLTSPANHANWDILDFQGHFVASYPRACECGLRGCCCWWVAQPVPLRRTRPPEFDSRSRPAPVTIVWSASGPPTSTWCGV